MSELPVDTPLASFGKRFFANILDSMLLFTVYGFILMGSYSFWASIFFLGWLYYAIFESSPGQATPGKKALGLVVCDDNGEKLSFGKATLRYFGKFVSGFTFGVGYMMIVFSDKRQALHDKIAGTLVLDKNARKIFPFENTQRTVLNIAKTHSGKITPVLVASETNLSIEQADKIIRDLCIHGHCRAEVTDDGRVEYHFPDFLPNP